MNSAAVATNQITLRVLGTSVTLLERLRLRAEQDLGIKIVYLLRSVEDAQRIAVMEPESYDLYDQWFHNIDFVWPARAIQPLEISRLTYWDEINALPKQAVNTQCRQFCLPCRPPTRRVKPRRGELGLVTPSGFLGPGGIAG
jgi:hypothetical protein